MTDIQKQLALARRLGRLTPKVCALEVFLDNCVSEDDRLDCAMGLLVSLLWRVSVEDSQAAVEHFIQVITERRGESDAIG
jgi:hypothetical protein